MQNNKSDSQCIELQELRDKSSYMGKHNDNLGITAQEKEQNKKYVVDSGPDPIFCSLQEEYGVHARTEKKQGGSEISKGKHCIATTAMRGNHQKSGKTFGDINFNYSEIVLVIIRSLLLFINITAL